MKGPEMLPRNAWGWLWCGFVAITLMRPGSMTAQQAWSATADALAEKIASVMGPGQADLSLRNLSSLPNDALPAVRQRIAEDLKTRGVSLTAADGANTLRITVSENARESLWVAELIEGNQTRVVMVAGERFAAASNPDAERLTLHRKVLLSSADLQTNRNSEQQPVLAAIEVTGAVAVLTPQSILILKRTSTGWSEQSRTDFNLRLRTRDPRGELTASADGATFTASLPGGSCTGSLTQDAAAWNVNCRSSDDPWPLGGSSSGPAPLKAFYNPERNFFTGVVAPNPGVDLAPFYTLAKLPDRAGASPLLLTAIDGTVQITEGGALKPVRGTRDWGSDFALLASGCGAGTQVIASNSGDPANDALRAYEVPAEEAVSASAPLTMEGGVVAMSTAADGKSVLAVIQSRAPQQQAYQYEVDRVTATCD